MRCPLHFPVFFSQHFTHGSESYVAPFDVNARDMNDQTPLHLACMSGHYDAAKTLLRCRVRPLNALGGTAATTADCKTTSGSTSSGVSSAVSAVADTRYRISWNSVPPAFFFFFFLLVYPCF